MYRCADCGKICSDGLCYSCWVDRRDNEEQDPEQHEDEW